jgi:hypothetical protein
LFVYVSENADNEVVRELEQTFSISAMIDVFISNLSSSGVLELEDVVTSLLVIPSLFVITAIIEVRLNFDSLCYGTQFNLCIYYFRTNQRGV